MSWAFQHLELTNYASFIQKVDTNCLIIAKECTVTIIEQLKNSSPKLS